MIVMWCRTLGGVLQVRQVWVGPKKWVHSGHHDFVGGQNDFVSLPHAHFTKVVTLIEEAANHPAFKEESP